MLIQEQKKKEVIMDVRIQAIHFDATAQLEAFIQKKGEEQAGQYNVVREERGMFR